MREGPFGPFFSSPLLLLLPFTVFPLIRSDTRTVSTSWGIVVGEVVSPAADDLPHITQFLGIPYGAAPVAQERFKMVQSAPKWTHLTKDARTPSPACIQSGLPELSETKAFRQTSAQRFDFLHRMLPRLKAQAEDCLYMNLFVPERLPQSARSPSLPVLVLIHGDEYGWGSGGSFNGTTLSSFGQLIVVTINYRLGVFGFLGRCESSSCQGNEGISDLVSALTMLNGILPAFGGNPREITLLGWGSGASLVSLLMASPMTQPSRRLFKRAILLDGTALAPWALSDDPQGHFLAIAEKLKCVNKPNKSTPYNLAVEDIVRCMQDHSWENITRVAATISAPTFLSPFAPIVDGQTVPNKPSALFSAQFGSLFREIDLMVGTVTHPAHYLLPNDVLRNGVDKEAKSKFLRTLVRNLYTQHRTEILAAIENEYTDWTNPSSRTRPESNKLRRDSVLSVLSDSLFVAPLIETLRAHSNDEKTTTDATTFFFHFGHETRAWASEQPNSGIRGALTGDSLPYILGYPLSRTDNEDKLYTGFDSDDRGVSRVMMHYVSNFVRSGDPQKPLAMGKQTGMEEVFSRMSWPQYNENNREAYLDIGFGKEKPVTVRNYYRNAYVGFWTGLVPQLHFSGREGVPVPEEHHFLPSHLNASSFYGRVRPYSTMGNIPFPPPPPGPPAPPDTTKMTTAKPSSSTDSSTSSAPSSVVSSPSSTVLMLTVCIGCGLLFLNICIFIGMYRTCSKNAKARKKLQILQYQTYSANQGQNPDLQYSLNSPLASMPPPPPGHSGPGPNASSNNSHSLMDDSFPLGNGILCGSLPRLVNGHGPAGHGTVGHAAGHIHNQHSRPNGSFSGHSAFPSPAHFQQPEQEPLLSASQKTSIAGIRPGVSPTCPRHGRSAMAAAAAAAASRGNSLASGNTLGGSTTGRDGLGAIDMRDRPLCAPATLEEIQV